MIHAGENLGPRHVAGALGAPVAPGDVFEVIRQGAAVVQGQLLAGEPMERGRFEELRDTLKLLPAQSALLAPAELTLSLSGLPVAIVDTPRLLALSAVLGERAPGLARGPLVKALFLAFARVAEGLAETHALGLSHGAIDVSRFYVTDDALPEALDGLKLGAFGLGETQAPPRRDLVELLRALHRMFTVAQTQPAGPASAKWLLLHQSAMHGEHPALESAGTLAATLRELARLDAEEDPRATTRPQRTATLTPARGASAGQASTRPSTLAGARHPAFVPDDATPREPLRRTERPTSGRARPPRPVPPAKTVRFGRTLAAATLSALTLVAVAAGLYLWKGRDQLSQIAVGQLLPGHPRASLRCPGENATSQSGARFAEDVTSFRAACVNAAEGPQLVVVAREGTSVRVASRLARRGEAFRTAVLPVDRGAVELGSALSTAADGHPSALWFSWRSAVGNPFTIARVEGSASQLRPFSINGWDDIRLRGANLVAVTGDTAWLSTSAGSDLHGHSLLVAVEMAPTVERPPVTVWRLGDAPLAATLPGPRPGFLLMSRVPNSHDVIFTLVEVDLALLRSARTNTAAPAELDGLALPPRAVTTREPLRFEVDEAVDVAPQGVTTPDGVHQFVMTLGAPLSDERAEATGHHVAPGRMLLLRIPAVGQPVASPLGTRGLAESLEPSPAGLRALVRDADPNGLPGESIRFLTLNSAGAITETSVGHGGGDQIVRIACGEDAWLLSLDPHQRARVLARPEVCLLPSLPSATSTR